MWRTGVGGLGGMLDGLKAGVGVVGSGGCRVF